MTPPIHLRPLRPDDADEMVVVLSDPALYTFTGGEPPAREGLSRQYAVQARGHSDDRSETWLNHLVVLDDTGEAVGYVQCRVSHSTDAGDHELFVCEVIKQVVLNPDKEVMNNSFLKARKLIRG